MVTIAGLDLAGLLGGAILPRTCSTTQAWASSLWGIRGDLRSAMTVGIVLLLASFVIAANIIVDVLYAFIDPRVKLA